MGDSVKAFVCQNPKKKHTGILLRLFLVIHSSYLLKYLVKSFRNYFENQMFYRLPFIALQSTSVHLQRQQYCPKNRDFLFWKCIFRHGLILGDFFYILFWSFL